MTAIFWALGKTSGVVSAEERGRKRLPRSTGIGYVTLPVGDVPLEVPDRHRIESRPHAAPRFALRFLRTDTTTDGGQRIRRPQDPRGARHVAGRHRMNEVGNRNPDRATLHADRILAAQAALGLEGGVERRVARVDFLEVVRALAGVPDRHRRLVGTFDRHHRISRAERQPRRSSAIRSSRTYTLSAASRRRNPPRARRSMVRPRTRTGPGRQR